jgi:hypothetical protein
VVPPEKLLTANPWRQFTWIEGTDKPIRQFDGKELVSILEYFAADWGGITVAGAAVKFALWSQSRLSEFTSMDWDGLRRFGNEVHFEWVGKFGVKKWARIPGGLYRELELLRMADSPFVFAAYTGQLRAFHAGTRFAGKVGDQFKPDALANWLDDRLHDWVASSGAEHASLHVFRKTALQFARDGEDLNRAVAADAQLTTSVLTGHYAREHDETLRAASNRTYARIQASLVQEGIAERFGHLPESEEDRLKEELRKATAAGNWEAVETIAARLQFVKSCEMSRRPRNSDFTESPEVATT